MTTCNNSSASLRETEKFRRPRNGQGRSDSYPERVLHSFLFSSRGRAHAGFETGRHVRCFRSIWRCRNVWHRRTRIVLSDTRFLSRLTLKLGKDRPLLLSSTVREDNAVLAVDATNPDVWRDSEIVVPRGTIHIYRSKILWDKVCYERLRIHNYGRAAVDFVLSIEFDADFADIFELRGTKREHHGRHF